MAPGTYRHAFLGFVAVVSFWTACGDGTDTKPPLGPGATATSGPTTTSVGNGGGGEGGATGGTGGDATGGNTSTGGTPSTGGSGGEGGSGGAGAGGSPGSTLSLQWQDHSNYSDDEYAYDVAINSNNDVIVVGTFKGLTQVADIANVLTGAGEEDVFIVKISATGQQSWVRQYGDSNVDVATTVAVDSNDNIIVGGTYQTELVGTGLGSATGPASGYLLALDDSGTLLHARNFPGAPVDIAVDPNNDEVVIVGGHNNNVIVQRYSTVTNFTELADVEGVSALGTQVANGVAIDASGGVVVVGEFTETWSILGGPAMTASTDKDMFVVRLTWNGSIFVHDWSRDYGDDTEQRAHAVAVDDLTPAGIYVVGVIQGDTLFGGNVYTVTAGKDGFMFKLNALAVESSGYQYGTTGDQEITSVVFDGGGDLLLAGVNNGDATLGGPTITSNGGFDILMGKVSPAGLHIWSVGYGDNGTQQPQAIVADNNNDVVVVGQFASALSFGGMNMLAPNTDHFIAKLGQP